MYFASCKRTLSPAINVLEDTSDQTRLKIDAGDASSLMGTKSKMYYTSITSPQFVGSGELELELIQAHMAQKPMLRVEVRARCVVRESKRKRGWFGWASAVCRAHAGCVWSL